VLIKEYKIYGENYKTLMKEVKRGNYANGET
jgi:hypothetical protein